MTTWQVVRPTFNTGGGGGTAIVDRAIVDRAVVDNITETPAEPIAWVPISTVNPIG